MAQKIVSKITPDALELIEKCDILIQSVNSLYEEHKDKNLYDALVNLHLAKRCIKLVSYE